MTLPKISRAAGHRPSLSTQRILHALLFSVLGLQLCACTTLQVRPASPAPGDARALASPNGAEQDLRIGSLRLIGQQVLPRRMEYAGTVVGGLSGIDYDAARGDYVLISDDRTPQDSPNPPRLYRARLDFDLAGFRAVRLTGVTFLRQTDGSVYPKVPHQGVPDPEAVRVDPVTRHLVWVSEGERNAAAQPPRIADPFIREVSEAGDAVREYSLPPMFRMVGGSQAADASQRGPRNNAVFEGMAFTPDARHLAVIMEAPLIQDGEPPTLERGALSRLTLFDRVSGQAVAQYAYPIDQVQASPNPPTAFRVNGPTEILGLSATRFLVLERSFSVGVVGNQVRLYEIDIIGADDVIARDSLADASGNLRAVSKRLVLNLETLKSALGGIANLEGLSFGPRLANGNRSLVMVADDNFPSAHSDTDRNQFLVFEVLPSP